MHVYLSGESSGGRFAWGSKERVLFLANGRAGSASVTAAIGLRGCLRFLRTEMMTALVFGFLLSL